MKVEIEVKEHNIGYYSFYGYLIERLRCAVIEPKTESKPNNQEMKNFSPLTPFSELLNFMYNQETKIKELQTKLNTYEIEEGLTHTVKHVQQDVKPVRTIHFEGQDIPEDEVVYFIGKITFEILSDKIGNLDKEYLKEDEDNSKIYRKSQTAELNARLKELVTERAKERKFTFNELKNFYKYEYTALNYAIELTEKELYIKYL